MVIPMNKHRSLITQAPLARGAVIATLLMCSGCFYFIEEGQGGAAERFPVQPATHSSDQEQRKQNIAQGIINYPQRFKKCQQQLAKLQNRALYQRYPVRFDDLSIILIHSQRMYQAQFYPLAMQYLQRAESLIAALESNSKSTQPKPEKTYSKPQLVAF